MTACSPPGPGAPGSEGARGLRADAARNRAAILAVARDVFAEQGLEAPLEVIAARAGVGSPRCTGGFPTARSSSPPRSSRRSPSTPRPRTRRWRSRIPGPGLPGSCSGFANCRPATAVSATCCR